MSIFICRARLPAVGIIAAVGCALASAGCSTLPDAPKTSGVSAETPEYLVGPGDTLQIFVWQNKDISTTLQVRPDGRITVPLVGEVECAGRTPKAIQDEITTRLKAFLKGEPNVTVIVSNFVGPYGQQVRVVGEATQPQAIPYRAHMTALDAMIAVGGLTAYAEGDRATLVRTVDGKQQSFRLRLRDLLKDGDIGANVDLQPGDVIIIPQSYF